MKAKDLKKALECMKASVQNVSIEDKIIHLDMSESSMKMRTHSTISDGFFVIPCNSKETGECYVDIDMLYKIVRSCKKPEINFLIKKSKSSETEEEVNSLIVKYGNSKFTLYGMNHSFPDVNLEFTNRREINPKAISRALNGLASYCDPNSTFITMKGLYMAEKTCYVATPARIACANSNPFEEKFFVYSNFIDFLSRLDETVFLSTDDGFLCIESDSFRFIFEIMREVNFPQIDAYIEKEIENRSVFDVDELKQIVLSASVVNPENIKLMSNNGSLNIASSDNLRSDFKTSIPAKFTSDFSLSVSFTSFKDALNIFDNGEVAIEIFEQTQSSPIRLVGGNLTQILSTNID